MSGVKVCLFGRFCVQRHEQVVPGLDARKVQELFSYLLLHRGRPQSREHLASILWGDGPTEQSRKYLRQTLWQLQMALNPPREPTDGQVLQVEPDWVNVNLTTGLWLDVAAFEKAFLLVEGLPSRDLHAESVLVVQEAVQLYQGDLLESFCLDWCLNERERLQTMYLALVDKLMGYCEVHHQYENGLGHGFRILRLDRASERTHRRLMRLQYLMGDRTAALRQYERCAAALAEELGVRPSRRTRTLYEQIQADQFEPIPPAAEPGAMVKPEPGLASEVLAPLKQLLRVLADVERQLQQHIQDVELNLKRRR